MTLLEVSDLHIRYGSSHVVRGVSLSLLHGQVLAVFGRNGVGKTSLVHGISGLARPSAGTVTLDGEELTALPPHEIARVGVSLVPQGRRVMGSLTVEENLMLAMVAPSKKGPAAWNLDEVYELLPRLAERRRLSGTSLSGGEQQMLAIGRALLRRPRVLLMDEPSEGLAPIVVEAVGDLCLELKSRSMSFLIIEQNLGLGLRVADQVVVMDHGQVAFAGTTDEFRADRDRAERLLGVV